MAKPAYEALPSDEPTIDAPGSSQDSLPRHPTFWRGRVSLVACIALLSIFAIGATLVPIAWYGRALWTSGEQYSRTSRWEECGGSPTIALERGCHYDIMMSQWVTDDCYDAELMESFLVDRKWRWYEDKNLTQEIPMSVIRRGEHGIVYSSTDFHFQHCMYTWRKQHRLFGGGLWMDETLLSHGHTVHCADLMLRHDEYVSTHRYTPVGIQYPACKILGSK